ncbi:bifunctional metallophosphatase/5'-nucleotidase [Alteraurantiacibacter buctensis]|uniref:Bifunctional metallophosphatase/5'-nucleotidase n=1 Tax=Alteraurantiacibacter buctensis TaxID=1503981 RepID=A0A844YRQ3_9SPHN|nr:bifunctional metallophosphatase/5'-nucleotidase [Alteraurantiacibacter buctensis]MXO71035.1 bifunctional metallophosphatase/5'-nucleotidase [Alteraurantiacibacter buctensis]
MRTHTAMPARRSAIAAAIACLLAGCVTVPAPAPVAQGPVEVQVLALNDFHGNLEVPPSTTAFSQDGQVVRQTLGGAARLAARLDALRQGQAATVTVAAGDLIGASPFASANFLDEPSVMALGMAGLDVASVGNHEFDRGTAELRRIQDGGCEQHTLRTPCALEPFAGADFTYLAGNVVDTGGRSLFPGATLRQVGPVKVGFIGLTLTGTATLVSPAMTRGYRFTDEADAANRLARDLTAQGADTVVLLIHEGGRVDPTQNLSGCPNLSGPIVPIVERLDPAISLVVSGHTHMSYICRIDGAGGPPRLLSSAGRYGGFVTDIRLTWDPAARRVADISAVNVPVNGTLGTRADVAALVDRYVTAAEPLAARVVGTVTPSGAADENCAETPAANLVADAQLSAARSALGEGIDAAFINTSGVRTNLDSAADGQLTYGEIFAMQPFGNTLQVLELTGLELRQALEEQFCNEGPATPCSTLLAPSSTLTYSYDRNRPQGDRVTAIRLDGVPINPEERYQVVFNNFLANGGDGFASLVQRRTVGEAGVDLDALEAYLAGGVTIPSCGRLRDLTAL